MLDGRDFFFLELNARIQVEHPVTELVTGVDLVQRAAPDRRGRAARRRPDGAAAATRSRCGSTPRTRARSFPRPAGSSGCGCPTGVRVETRASTRATRSGIGYDPMIAKLIAHGPTRDEALDRLRDALAETEVAGVVTNLPFLRWLVAHPALRAGETTTAFLVDHPPLSSRRCGCPTGPWRGAFRLNLPLPPPAAAAGRRRGGAPPRRRRRRRARSSRRCPAR